MIHLEAWYKEASRVRTAEGVFVEGPEGPPKVSPTVRNFKDKRWISDLVFNKALPQLIMALREMEQILGKDHESSAIQMDARRLGKRLDKYLNSHDL